MRKIAFLFIAVLCAGMAASCDDDNNEVMETNLYPWHVQLSVEDRSGNDLLDPENENAISGEGLTLTYKGEKYHLQESATETRAYMPRWNGITRKKIDGQGYVLSIGEFGPDFDKDETMTLDWGDGTEDVLRVVFDVKYGNKDIDIDAALYINGQEVEDAERTSLLLQATIVK